VLELTYCQPSLKQIAGAPSVQTATSGSLGQDRQLREYIPIPAPWIPLRAGTGVAEVSAEATDTLRRILTLHEQLRTAIARSARKARGYGEA